jgi:two-component system, OmpR family, heavy metal sensor histidine kinase CusS
MMRSLKGRLLVGTVTGMACLLIIFGLLIYTVVRHTLVASFDSSLAMAAKAVAGQVELGKMGVEAESQDLRVPAFVRRHRAYFFEIWLEDRSVLARSISLGDAHLEPFAGPFDVPVFRSVTLPDGQPGRAVSLTFSPRPADDRPLPAHSPRVLLVLARGSEPMTLHLRTLKWLLLAGDTGTVLVSLLLAVAVVRRGLQPLHTLAKEIANISTERLQIRVGAKAMPAEMLPVADKLNQLLVRLEEGFERERCFTSDVAHEMRTPLAGLRSTIEVSLLRTRTGAEYRESLAECLAIGKRMQSMVDSLLTLARLDAGQVPLNPDRILISDEVNRCWQDYGPAAAQRGVVFHNAIPVQPECTADRQLFLLILSNLLSNAAEYTNDGGQIHVTVEETTPPQLEISNTGCQLDAEQVTHVFDRFWRGGDCRSPSGDHCGLGLALVQRAANVLGWQIRADVAEDRFRVQLTLGRNAACLNVHRS